MPVLTLTTTMAAKTGHNTSANSAYNLSGFPANFSGQTWMTTGGVTAAVNSALMDDSWNPVTPGHVSNVSIKTLLGGTSLPVRLHTVPWFGSGSHMNIGENFNTTTWANNYIADCKRRGFTGIIIDWYGSGRFEDSVTLKLQTAIAAAGGFDFIIMIDQGGYSTLAQLQTQLAYVQTQYLGDPNYGKTGGKPIIQFFGLPLSSANMVTAKAGMTIATHWMVQGTSPGSYADGTFDWVQPWSTGIPTDRYNAAATNAYLTGMHSSSLTSMPCLAAKFNGYLTRITEGGYKEGWVLPSDSGKCWISQAATILANIPTNCIGYQIATGTDLEEGSAIESGIDNFLAIGSTITGSILAWSASGGTGDESTLDHYEVIATPNGIDVAILATPAIGAGNSFDLSTVTGYVAPNYTIYVLAVGKSCILQKKSAGIVYTPGVGGGIVRSYSAFFLNSGSNIVQLELIEISHPLFSQIYRLVRNAIAGVTVTLEDATIQTFSYYPLKITPSGSYNDMDQTLQVQFGDLGQILPMELDRLIPAPGVLPGTVIKPTLLYRTYRSDDLSGPLSGPFKFTIDNISFQKEGATMQCSAARLNLTATGELYSMDRFPMLRGFL